MMLTPIVIALAAMGAIGASALYSWYFSEHQQRLRELRDVDPVRIADAKDGDVVRIVGVLRKHEHLIPAPLTGRLCAHFDVRVLEYVSSGKSGSYVLRFQETDVLPFVIEDESGRALIETTRFVGAVVRDENRRSGTFHDASPAMEAILARHGMESTGTFGLNRGLRYEEGVLEPGERVTVLGRARWEDDPDEDRPGASRGGYRDSARRRRLVIEAGVRPVRASDDPVVTRPRGAS